VLSEDKFRLETEHKKIELLPNDGRIR